MSQIYFIWSNTLHVSDGLSVHHQGIESHVTASFFFLNTLWSEATEIIGTALMQREFCSLILNGRKMSARISPLRLQSPVRNICTMWEAETSWSADFRPSFNQFHLWNKLFMSMRALEKHWNSPFNGNFSADKPGSVKVNIHSDKTLCEIH